MITVIRRATAADYFAFFNDVIPGWVVYNNGERIGMGGISWNAVDERWWGYLTMKGKPNHDGAMRIIREMQNGLRAIPHDVYVICDEKNYLSAPRLLRILGFEPTEETNFGLDVWVHRATEGE